MKIGILTFHHGINHGGFLQTYALQNTLRQLGYENKIINYRNIRHFCKKYRLLFFTPRLVNNFRKWLKFRRNHKQLDMSHFAFTVKKVAREYFDVVILGSDEIWNFENPMFGFDPIYFGNGLNSKRVISYAASFGAFDADKRIPKEICESINKISHVSVRDENCQKIISRITGKNVPILLDPTFLYDFVEERECPSSNFILVYGIFREKEHVDGIQSFARSQNKNTISIAYRNPWCDINIISLDAFELLEYFKRADMVITNMFHGTLFSIKYNKAFCTILTPYRKHKYEPMLFRLGLSDRVLSYDNPLDRIFSREIDFGSVNGRLDAWISESLQFIRGAMCVKKIVKTNIA